MFLDEFHTRVQGQVRISAQQASRFAKHVAGDYNPIHNPDARRFCVPGDLLFALVLQRFGLSRRMSFRFLNMVAGGTLLSFVEHDDSHLSVCGDDGKCYLEVERGGENTRDEGILEAFTRCYVAFSGKNFPHYLKPLMEAKGVMFNPRRPLVIYDSMGFSLDSLEGLSPGLELTNSSLHVIGKRADVQLEFLIHDGDTPAGTGSKKLVVSGLQAYDPVEMDAIVGEFYRLKAAYEAEA